MTVGAANLPDIKPAPEHPQQSLIQIGQSVDTIEHGEDQLLDNDGELKEKPSPSII